VADYIECKVFDDIYPWSSYDSTRMDPEPAINTAMLHRYYYLARQCREYFIQLTSQLYAQQQQQQSNQQPAQTPQSASSPLPLSAAAQSVFQFNPFRGADDDKAAAVDKSRFGFAHVGELADRFDKSATISNAGSAQQQHQQAQMYR
jgi:hypothetical protein